MSTGRRNSLTQIVSSLDSHSREVIEVINNVIHLPRRLSFESNSNMNENSVIVKSVRKTSIGFDDCIYDDYVTYPTSRHVILDTSRSDFDTKRSVSTKIKHGTNLDTSRPIIDTSNPRYEPGETKQGRFVDCYHHPEMEVQVGSNEKTSSSDSWRKHPKNQDIDKPGSDVSRSESPNSSIPRSESPNPAVSRKQIEITDLDCPMCKERIASLKRGHQDKTWTGHDRDKDENYNAVKPYGSNHDLDHVSPNSSLSRDQSLSRDSPSRGVRFSDRKSDHRRNPGTSEDFNPGQVFAITRPSFFGSSKKSVTFNSEFDTDQVVMTFHQRRDSNFPNLAPVRRPSAIVSTFFGTSGFGRRFSEDLRLKGGIPGINDDKKGETYKVLFYQVFIPFLIAGFGNVAAGVLLEVVQHWQVYKSLPELFLLVASFLGFKGNLEMALAARLATQSHLGQLDRPSAQVKVLIGNMALIQAQAIVVGFLAALIAIFVNIVRHWAFNESECLLLMSTSLMTATITGLIMTVMMVIVTIFSRRIGANPDNVSTLTAACFGDILAVIILSFSAKSFFALKSSAPSFEPITIFGFILIILPMALWIARKNCYTRAILGTGWYPIIVAMCISSAGGLIFDFAVEYFDTIAIFEPIINGVGSNLVAVQASRISTYFHQRCDIGTLPEDPNSGRAYKVCQTPTEAFFGSNPNVKTARFLLLMTIPGHIIYLLTMKWIQGPKVHLTGTFVFFYLITAIIQVIIVLYLAHVIVPWLWKKGHDPDNAAVPGLMAMGDFFGSALLTLTFILLYSISDPNITNNPVKIIH